ncbi:MAG: DUF1365 domain-containing protein [Pseudomonadales bacterium]|nr:DUF1365 domain-containing protein [Pseudomonadales bacterium]
MGWVYEGRVMHERLHPHLHGFVYPVFYVRVNLKFWAELDQFWLGIDRWAPLALHQRDMGPRDGSDLSVWARQLWSSHGIEVNGDIHMQTFPRIMGYAFVPVSFFYGYDEQGCLRSVIADVNNTFGQHCHYVVADTNGRPLTEHSVLRVEKSMHVSPFFKVEGHYEFHVREQDSTSFMGIDYCDDDGCLIKTAISGSRQPLGASSLRRAWLKQPLLTVGITARILGQALRLWSQGLTFYSLNKINRMRRMTP